MEGKMGGQEVYVEVDVSKERLDLGVRSSAECFSEANDKQAVGRLVKRLKGLNCARVVVEATGGYETVMVAALCADGVPVVVVNPRWVRDFAKSIGWLEKDRPHRCQAAGAVRRACRAQGTATAG
jgi:transposase